MSKGGLAALSLIPAVQWWLWMAVRLHKNASDIDGTRCKSKAKLSFVLHVYAFNKGQFSWLPLGVPQPISHLFHSTFCQDMICATKLKLSPTLHELYKLYFFALTVFVLFSPVIILCCQSYILHSKLCFMFTLLSILLFLRPKNEVEEYFVFIYSETTNWSQGPLFHPVLSNSLPMRSWSGSDVGFRLEVLVTVEKLEMRNSIC